MRKNKEASRSFVIGIDIGGTNADVALYDCMEGRICAQAKVPTDHVNYPRTLRALLERVACFFPQDLRDVVSINIATTLSTNAILEGRGAPVNLVLIGFERKEHLMSEILRVLKPHSLALIRGGHTSWGKEQEPLDEAALRASLSAHTGELFAVSSMFSPRNPAHEIRTANLIGGTYCGTASCGFEMAGAKLNAVKRTVTAYLNASLIPLVERFTNEVERTIAEFGLYAPIMFLKSDSTLVSSKWCRQYPIETIFSGPAASMRGAYHLVRAHKPEKLIVADIGGTSTDIGLLKDGKPVFSREGAVIGDYRTMIPSLDICSVALGGDSEVQITAESAVQIGPRRVLPFCRSEEYAGRADRPDCVPVGYTPTDALNTLGKACVGRADLSKNASAQIGERAGCTAEAFARSVWESTLRKLEKNIATAAGSDETGLRVYVGGPGQVFAADSKGARVLRIDKEDSGVASAIGAATSSIELKCEAVVVHSFFDETYSAFLPQETLRGTEMEMLLEESERRMKEYLTGQSRFMGELDGTVSFTRTYTSLQKKSSPEGVVSVTIFAEFLPFI